MTKWANTKYGQTEKLVVKVEEYDGEFDVLLTGWVYDEDGEEVAFKTEDIGTYEDEKEALKKAKAQAKKYGCKVVQE